MNITLNRLGNTHRTIIEDEVYFTNSQGVALPFSEIIKKKITSFSFIYREKISEANEPDSFFDKIMKLLSMPASEKWATKQMTIESDYIKMGCTEDCTAIMVRFDNQDAFDALQNYDTETLHKKTVMSLVGKHSLHFLFENLEMLDWE
ncbi:MAG: hypothetical protein LRY44_00155 [Candidatus Pacebacteria bacterium]|nr:hypothetical protein [Candidatus Paceibacterota bacterium]MCD8563427.1 hypothetical protein [Candidatus Paceibacterota bacterium]